ncbi:CesT family type III secretion system chaperone [Ramlibacter rhizophilus]|nr:CesT family type III secretion system chaperone [Ramlibacter rhizophilus]
MPEATDPLLAGLCGRLGLPPQDWVSDAGGLRGITLRLDDVDISLVDRPQEPVGPTLCLLVEFGAPAPERELEIWRTLADANFLMLGPDAPAFGRNPATGEVLLQYACPRDAATAAGLHRSLLEMARIARHWRHAFNLRAEDGSVGPEPLWTHYA